MNDERIGWLAVAQRKRFSKSGVSCEGRLFKNGPERSLQVVACLADAVWQQQGKLVLSGQSMGGIVARNVLKARGGQRDTRSLRIKHVQLARDKIKVARRPELVTAASAEPLSPPETPPA
jgi:hypothetical protein